MRYANLYDDPYSTCSAIQQECDPDWNGHLMIAQRSDLVPKNGTYHCDDLKHSGHGALDSKITSKRYAMELKMRAISSPPHDEVPVFDWSTVQSDNVSHIGLPDRWEFPWFDVTFNSTF